MADQTWTIQRILDWTRNYLERKGDEHPRRSAEWLLSDATGLSRVELYTNFDRPLSPAELARMHSAVEKRAAGEPLQYITGEMAFRHIILRCEEGVLIPRPETEVLVDAVLEHLEQLGSSETLVANVLDAKSASADCSPREPLTQDSSSETLVANVLDAKSASADCSLTNISELQTLKSPTYIPRVLDLCTGTGCIALSVAREHPETVVIATDLSPRAVSLAERNTNVLGLGGWVDVLECDLAEAVVPEFWGSFDVVVSNPPYIPSAILAQDIPSEVRDHEPKLALDGGEDGLDVYRRILEIAPQLLRPGGLLAVELFEDSLAEAAALAQVQACWEGIEIREDLTHRPRILLARKRGE